MLKLFLLTSLLFISSGCLTPVQKAAKTYSGDDISIASWNLQIYGESKMAKAMDYASYMKHYDIVFIQEIRSKDSTAFNVLCAAMADYSCLISSRAGSTSSKEQYGVFYKKGIDLVDTYDYNPSLQGEFERPPFQTTFKTKNGTFVVLISHTKPDNAKSEISELSTVAQQSHSYRKIVLGDLNADCNYYSRNPMDFPDSEWNWVIDDYKDTTSGKTNCAYDRIIATDNINVVSSGVVETPSTLSDHYLVHATIRMGG